MANEKVKRLRMFAGPNGSGKSTMLDEVNRQFNIGYYVNADAIELELRKHQFVDLKDYNIEGNQSIFQQFLLKSTLYKKAEKADFSLQLALTKNQIINYSTQSFSYEAALIAAFIRQELLNGTKTFSFETVMSHSSKVETLKKAKAAGFKTYLYFISTKSADINVQRVAK